MAFGAISKATCNSTINLLSVMMDHYAFFLCTYVYQDDLQPTRLL
jgi:hypothetical protein